MSPQTHTEKGDVMSSVKWWVMFLGFYGMGLCLLGQLIIVTTRLDTIIGLLSK